MISPVAVRDAATVMLVRDREEPDADGRRLEVFMLRRNLRSDFVGGVHVFPGGAVDGGDRRLELEPFCTGRTDAEASRVLNLPSGGLAFWVAAIRECFEEAGVLLATDTSGQVVRLDQADVEARFREHRRAVDAGTLALLDLCARESLCLPVGDIHYFSHWITPVGPPRRYDTRFFVTAAPKGQHALHDDRETIANLWIDPAEALARHQRGQLDLILPTIRNLAALARFEKAADVLAAAAGATDVPTILPRIIDDGGGVRILLPGDDGYDDVAVSSDGGPPDLPAGFPLTSAAAPEAGR